MDTPNIEVISAYMVGVFVGAVIRDFICRMARKRNTRDPIERLYDKADQSPIDQVRNT